MKRLLFLIAVATAAVNSPCFGQPLFHAPIKSLEVQCRDTPVVVVGVFNSLETRFENENYCQFNVTLKVKEWLKGDGDESIVFKTAISKPFDQCWQNWKQDEEELLLFLSLDAQNENDTDYQVVMGSDLFPLSYKTKTHSFYSMGLPVEATPQKHLELTRQAINDNREYGDAGTVSLNCSSRSTVIVPRDARLAAFAKEVLSAASVEDHSIETYEFAFSALVEEPTDEHKQLLRDVLVKSQDEWSVLMERTLPTGAMVSRYFPLRKHAADALAKIGADEIPGIGTETEVWFRPVDPVEEQTLNRLSTSFGANVSFDVDIDNPPEQFARAKKISWWDTNALNNAGALPTMDALSELHSVNLNGPGLDQIDLSALVGVKSLRSLTMKQMKFEDIRHVGMLTGLKELDCFHSTSLEDIRALSRLKKLESLDLSWTNVSDLSPIAELHSLKVLMLGDMPARDMSPLAGLRNIEELQLPKGIKDISIVMNFPNLKVLNLNRCGRIEDWSPIASLENIEELQLGGSNIDDLSVISGLSNVKVLNLIRTPVTDLSPLRNLTRLKVLKLRETEVVDLSPIAGLTSLEEVNLDGSAVRDVTALKDLTNLNSLVLLNINEPVAGLHLLPVDEEGFEFIHEDAQAVELDLIRRGSKRQED